MRLNQEISKLFATTPINNASKIQSLESPFEAWVIRTAREYGVGIPITHNVQILERFVGAKLYTIDLIIKGVPHHLLLLTS